MGRPACPRWEKKRHALRKRFKAERDLRESDAWHGRGSLFETVDFMEKTLILVFWVLFFGRMVLRYVLQRLNLNHLRTYGREVPAVFAGQVDAGTLEKMTDYTVERSRLESKENLASDLLDLAVLFLLLPVLTAWLGRLSWPLVVQALIFFAILGTIGGIAGLPFDLYHTFVLERRYGFSTISWKLWLVDLLKSLVLSAVLFGIIIGALMAFVLYLPHSWWFWGWLFFIGFQITLLWVYPIWIAPLFNTFEPITDQALADKISILLAKAGIASGGIFQADEGKRSKHTNAYFTGFGKTKRIVLFDTLLQSHTHEEILSVLAHEIGHWKKKHLLKQLAFGVGGSLILFYIVSRAVGWPPLYHAFGLTETPIYAGFFLVSLYGSAAAFFLSPVGAAVTRRFEREADQMSFELTGSAEPLIQALKRLARDNLSNLHPHPWYVRFFYSHPPLAERIEYLKAMDYKNGKP